MNKLIELLKKIRACYQKKSQETLAKPSPSRREELVNSNQGFMEQSKINKVPVEKFIPYDLLRPWIDSMEKPIDDPEPEMRYKITSVSDPEAEDALSDLPDYKPELTLNEARKLLGRVVHGCIFCGGVCYKATEDSATLLFDSQDLPDTFKIECIG